MEAQEVSPHLILYQVLLFSEAVFKWVITGIFMFLGQKKVLDQCSPYQAVTGKIYRL